MHLAITEVRDRVRNIRSVSTLPNVLARILAIVHNESSTAIDLAAEISADQALTLRVLRVVNSGYYGFQRRIATIPEAVVILGFTEVERLALAISVINWFGHDARTVRSMRMLWQHSLACAVGASVIEQKRPEFHDELLGAHAGGLLHDLGKAVIMQHLPDASDAIHRLVCDEEMSCLDAEREVLDGATHCVVGAWLAEEWNLPPALVSAIDLHHRPEDAVHHQSIVYAAHIADAIANRAGLCAPGEAVHREILPVASEGLRADDALYASITAEIEQHRGVMSAVVSGMGTE